MAKAQWIARQLGGLFQISVGDSGSGDSRNNRLFDGSVEPPFRIGMSCGACHISYNPFKPPADANNPKWENIDGLVGNQYSRISQLLASGMSQHVLEWQLIARTRPGTVDTSALPMDTASNPGTMNPIYNFARRPTFDHRMLKWRKAARPARGSQRQCAGASPGKPGNAGSAASIIERVQNILKGGEDSIGAREAIQRVYFNIGSCAEQCWLNHVPDLRAVDPAQRNYGQTPFDIGQCRRDCASFRAIEDRLGRTWRLFPSARPTDLGSARAGKPGDLEAQLNVEFGDDSVARGRQVFAKPYGMPFQPERSLRECGFPRARSQGQTLRNDFLSSERPVLASRVGTYAGRAMHSNHMASRVWDQYAARDLHERPVDAGSEGDVEGQWSRILPSAFALQRLGVCTVHAQQRDRS